MRKPILIRSSVKFHYFYNFPVFHFNLDSFDRLSLKDTVAENGHDYIDVQTQLKIQANDKNGNLKVVFS